MLRQNRYPPKSLLFRGLHPVFVVYSIVFMSIHYLMRLITQLRANIPLCAAKQMQIESRTCQACLGNYAEISCQREQSQTCLGYAECSRYSTKLNAALLMQSYKFSLKQMSKCLYYSCIYNNLTFLAAFPLQFRHLLSLMSSYINLFF